MKHIDLTKGNWLFPPKEVKIDTQKLTFTTSSHTDMWQKTYYGFEPNNAPMLLFEIEDPFFSFEATVAFDSKVLYDQAGIILYHNPHHWMKASIEYEDQNIQRLGSVVTTYGYSDWATTDIPQDVKQATYRLSRRNMDFKIEVSFDQIHFQQLRIYHDPLADGVVKLGFYACSPQQSSFPATFSDVLLKECLWD